MIALSQFNSLSEDEAVGLLALRGDPAWGETLVNLRPFRQPPCAAADRPGGDG